jgi:hypothetical protein
MSNFKFEIVDIFLYASSVFSVPAVVNASTHTQLKFAPVGQFENASRINVG